MKKPGQMQPNPNGGEPMKSPLLGIFGGLIALVGLFMSAGTDEGAMFFGGMVFFLFGVALNFWLIACYEHKPKQITPAPSRRIAPAE